MSKSSAVTHEFGAITSHEPMLPSIINITSSNLVLSHFNSGAIIINQYTAGTTHVSIPLEARVSFKFIQAQPTHQVYITASTSGCPSVFNGHYMCGTVGSSFTNASDVDFSNGTGSVGDTIDVVCDGVKYYVNGVSANPNGLIYNDC
jgi:hypothetical protein